jgi:peroxin-2
MPAADFAAAQARLSARRQETEARNATRIAQREAVRAASTSRLPGPFRHVSDAGLSLWDSIRGREGTKPAFRVGQVDAELLDEELLELLKAQVGEALKYYGVRTPSDVIEERIRADFGG